MQYLALIYSAPGTSPEYGTPEFAASMEEWQKITQTYIDDGVMVSGDALQDPETATSIRIRDGKMETIDGPYAETKEHLGGYYLLNCKDLDEAIKYAVHDPVGQIWHGGSAPDHGSGTITPVAVAGEVSLALQGVMAESHGKLLSALIANLKDFQLAEDSLQDALASAFVHWERSGRAEKPAGLAVADSAAQGD